NILEFGNKDIDKIQEKCFRYDKLQSCLSKYNKKKDKWKIFTIKRSMHRISFKIKNLIKDCHHKIIRYIYENYQTILLPKFETQDMACNINGNRKISSKTAKKMLDWSHYKFKMFLRHKTREYPEMNLIECTEEYTSKTCTRCGIINEKLRGSKNFSCSLCGLKIDRDHNATTSSGFEAYTYDIYYNERLFIKIEPDDYNFSNHGTMSEKEGSHEYLVFYFREKKLKKIPDEFRCEFNGKPIEKTKYEDVECFEITNIGKYKILRNDKVYRELTTHYIWDYYFDK
ncbi:10009_t:CDS:2, partial [Scutellospora calospora]